MKCQNLHYQGKFKGVLGTLDHYDKVFILDLDLQPEVIEVVDKKMLLLLIIMLLM